MYETPNRDGIRRPPIQPPPSEPSSRLSRLNTRSSANFGQGGSHSSPVDGSNMSLNMPVYPNQTYSRSESSTPQISSISGLGMTLPGSPIASQTPQGGLQGHMLQQSASTSNFNANVNSSQRRPRKISSMAQINRRQTPRRGSGVDVYTGTIHVGVRARPTESTEGPWILQASANSLTHETAGLFTFDKVYDGYSSNSEVFDASIGPLIKNVCEGFNATVLAYGTTGSGKTYTMQGSQEDPGVIQRSVRQLFDTLSPDAEIGLSYFEIYNERIYDLLAENNEPTEVTLRDSTKDGTLIVGHREVIANSSIELLDWISSGDRLRRTSSTQYNTHSSRSHAVVKIRVKTSEFASVLYLCDLAGSERAVFETDRRREGSFINKSLLTLSTVISILSQKSNTHVPYRDSKLTRLLQPSLSGSALVSLVCTIHPQSHSSVAETLNSVRFAAKTKNIVVTATRGTISDDVALSGTNLRMLDHLQHENEALRKELWKTRLEKEDLRDRLELLEQSADTETSLEAMTGISFDESVTQPNSLLVEKLTMDLDKAYKDNTELENQVSHLVEELKSVRLNLGAHISELEEQLKDKSLALFCWNNAQSSVAFDDYRVHTRENIDSVPSRINNVQNNNAGDSVEETVHAPEQDLLSENGEEIDNSDSKDDTEDIMNQINFNVDALGSQIDGQTADSVDDEDEKVQVEVNDLHI